MKVVINNCFGGFGLSHKAVMRYAELKDIKLYAWVDDIAKKTYGENAKPEDVLFAHYTTVPQGEYEAILKEEAKKPVSPKRYEKSNVLYFTDKDIPRTNPDLIKIIKEMGDEANGRCAKLKIIEIPDDIEWEIEEYDGNEWVAEKHRRWD